MNNVTKPSYLKEVPGCTLAAIPPEAWHLLTFPDYQRTPAAHRVRQIAQGLREGYDPAPVILYAQAGKYLIVDGGHRILAHRLNRDRFAYERDVIALIYTEEAIDQHVCFVNENNKLRMDPTAIIRADNRRHCCAIIRRLGEPDRPFNGLDELADYPIRPLSIVKAALILHAQGAELEINRLAYYSVSRALDHLEAIITTKAGGAFWVNVVEPFLKYETELWGVEGRHLVNFGVLAFALFLSKNRPRFFDAKGNLVIKTTRHSVSEKRRAAGRQAEFEDKNNSDFAKLAVLACRWNELGDQLHIYAPKDPVRVAYEINLWFWKNRPVSQRIWRPELSL